MAQIFQKLFKSIHWKILLSVSYPTYSHNSPPPTHRRIFLVVSFVSFQMSLCKYKQIQIYFLIPPFLYTKDNILKTLFCTL